ncbi:MAG: DNA polymerase IV [Desulfobacterales bacterium]
MIIHVDMDAFFASVEQLDNPTLVAKPVIVGGTSGRGVVAAASYEARKYGVRSAMPVFQARQKCPDGIFVPPRRHRYKDVSRTVMSVLQSFTPLVEQISIDEAFLDVTGCEAVFGPPREIGIKIKHQVKATVGLTCSVGIAPLKFLAKIASDMDKPDGLTFIAPEDVDRFIAALPVEKISGVGKKAGQALHQLGIATLGDVKKFPRENLVAHLGKYGSRLYELARGIDRSPVTPVRPVKSVSAEETLAADVWDKEKLKKYLLRHSEEVGRQLRKKGRKARTVTVKIKYADFTLKTRQTKLSRSTSAAEIIYQAAVGLLENFSMGQPARLVGVGASDLDGPGRGTQLELFAATDNPMGKWEKIGPVMDGIAAKFGPDAIKKAGLTGPDKKSI